MKCYHCISALIVLHGCSLAQPVGYDVILTDSELRPLIATAGDAAANATGASTSNSSSNLKNRSTTTTPNPVINMPSYDKAFESPLRSRYPFAGLADLVGRDDAKRDGPVTITVTKAADIPKTVTAGDEPVTITVTAAATTPKTTQATQTAPAGDEPVINPETVAIAQTTQEDDEPVTETDDTPDTTESIRMTPVEPATVTVTALVDIPETTKTIKTTQTSQAADESVTVANGATADTPETTETAHKTQTIPAKADPVTITVTAAVDISKTTKTTRTTRSTSADEEPVTITVTATAEDQETETSTQTTPLEAMIPTTTTTSTPPQTTLTRIAPIRVNAKCRYVRNNGRLRFRTFMYPRGRAYPDYCDRLRDALEERATDGMGQTSKTRRAGKKDLVEFKRCDDNGKDEHMFRRGTVASFDITDWQRKGENIENALAVKEAMMAALPGVKIVWWREDGCERFQYSRSGMHADIDY